MTSKIYIKCLTGAIAAIAIVCFSMYSLPNGFSLVGPLAFQKGMCYVTWNEEGYNSPKSDESLKAMAETGVNCVQIVVTWYQERVDSFIIKRVDGRTPSDPSLIRAIKKAHQCGMYVMLKPHVDLIKDEGNSRMDIGFSDDGMWEKWFSEYRNFIKYYAKLAEEYGVELFCVGTELSYAATKTDVWKNSIIPSVRKVFSGKLTYAANWDDYQKVKFWDDLDYAGIDAYFPLVIQNDPTLAQLKEAWKKWAAEIEAWQSQIKKPVLFTECGYCSADTAPKRPWEEVFSVKPNLQLQASCYRALFETFWDKPWFKGVYWWAWNTYAGSGGENNCKFTPQNKPAIECLKTFYSQEIRG
ncbi:MAG: glycoside hydrolase [Candidatus Omnitrophica bacterium]|nr:glycoside hydrolase [Candidatus Omnitrophota bacterium]